MESADFEVEEDVITAQLSDDEFVAVIHHSLNQVESIICQAHNGDLASKWYLAKNHPDMLTNLIQLMRDQLCAFSLMQAAYDRLKERHVVPNDYLRRIQP